MEGEASPFIEVSGGGYKNTLSLLNCIDISFICNILIIIAIMYIIYMICNNMYGDSNMSFVEEQVRKLNKRQDYNLRC